MESINLEEFHNYFIKNIYKIDEEERFIDYKRYEVYKETITDIKFDKNRLYLSYKDKNNNDSKINFFRSRNMLQEEILKYDDNNYYLLLTKVRNYYEEKKEIEKYLFRIDVNENTLNKYIFDINI